jgi:hypothetical protein
VLVRFSLYFFESRAATIRSAGVAVAERWGVAMRSL